MDEIVVEAIKSALNDIEKPEAGSVRIEVKTIGLVHNCADGKNKLEGMWHLSFQEIRWRLTSDKFKFCPYCSVVLPILMSSVHTFCTGEGD